MNKPKAGKRNEGKLDTNFPSHEQANLQISRRDDGYCFFDCYRPRPAWTINLVAGQQPVGAGAVGNRAQRHFLQTLMLGQGRSLIGLLYRCALIHNDTSVWFGCATALFDTTVTPGWSEAIR